MKFIQKILLILLITINIHAIELNKNLILDMGRTYGYYVGQTYALDSIEKKYPNLKNDVFLVKNEFDLKYLKSLKEIEKNFSKHMTKKQWDEFKANTKKKIIEQLNYDYISQQDALNFIQEVKTRATGNIESPVIETLLMFNQTYQKNPISELSDNFFQKYNSKDNPKAKGVNFTVKAPRSWKSEEANRPKYS